jgi:hypothetical protein
MNSLYLFPRTGACVAFLLLGELCTAQAEMVLFTHTGLSTEDDSGWAPQPKMLEVGQMKRALHLLQKHSTTDTSSVSSPFSVHTWGGLAHDFDLAESVIPGFRESTVVVGQGHRLSAKPSGSNGATYFESPLRPRAASFAGFRSIETLRYTTEEGLTKTVHRMFPMESLYAATHGLDEPPLTSAMGYCDCPPWNKPIRKKHTLFQEDVVVDVPLGDPYAWPNLGYRNVVRAILGDVNQKAWTAVHYSVPAGVVPTEQEREEVPFTMKLYDEWGEVMGTKDTVFVTPRVGDEFGEALSREELRDAMIDHYAVNQYDDYGEVVGTVDIERNIPVHSIAGMRFYETWIFAEGQPCPRKQVNSIVLLRDQWDMDGVYQGLAPLSFALLMR